MSVIINQVLLFCKWCGLIWALYKQVCPACGNALQHSLWTVILVVLFLVFKVL